MSEFHGRLLIGGMALGNLFGTLEQESSAPDAKWGGELLIDPNQIEFLESGRPYRLELADGRAGQVVVTRVDCIIGRRKIRVVFDGLSSLKESAVVIDEPEHVDVGI